VHRHETIDTTVPLPDGIKYQYQLPYFTAILSINCSTLFLPYFTARLGINCSNLLSRINVTISWHPLILKLQRSVCVRINDRAHLVSTAQ